MDPKGGIRAWRFAEHTTDRRSESSPESSRRLVKNAVQAASRRRLAARADGRLVSSADLAAVVSAAVPVRGADRGRIHPATRTFQALRIAVNHELEVIAPALAGALAALRPGGRLAVISYHSGEDRIVKRFIARESRDCIEDPLPPVCMCGHRAQLRPITKGVVRPTADEVGRNRRARSARLRAAIKVAPASA